MFIVRYFKKSIFSLKKIYDLKDESLWKTILYFFILSLLCLFPYNLTIINEGGFKLGFVSETYEAPNIYELGNSKIEKVGIYGLVYEGDFEVEVYNFNDLTLVIDYDSEYEVTEENKNILVLKKENIEFYKDNGGKMVGSYNNLDRTFYFSEFNHLSGTDTAELFFDGLEEGFSKYVVLFSVINYTLSGLGMYIIYILLLTLLLWFLQYGFTQKLPFKMRLNILIFSMTLPATIIFIISWFGLYTLAPIIFNFMTGGISLLVFYKVVRHRINLKSEG